MDKLLFLLIVIFMGCGGAITKKSAWVVNESRYFNNEGLCCFSLKITEREYFTSASRLYLYTDCGDYNVGDTIRFADL